MVCVIWRSECALIGVLKKSAMAALLSSWWSGKSAEEKEKEEGGGERKEEEGGERKEEEGGERKEASSEKKESSWVSGLEGIIIQVVSVERDPLKELSDDYVHLPRVEIVY